MKEKLKITPQNRFDEVLEKKIEDFFKSYYKNSFDEDEEDLKILKINERIEGEKSFYNHVLENLNKANKENPGKEIISLFDIDETLVKAKINREGSFDHIIRPSAVDLLNKIKSLNIKIGLLTSRSKLEEQLENELKEIAQYINTSNLYSTRGYGVSSSDEDAIENNLPNELKNSFVSGDYEKIKFLNNEIVSHLDNTNKVFVPIDDFKYPILYKYGVALKDKEKFFL